MTVLDATDEQFEAFIKQVGIPVRAGDEGQRWSFDNRCRAINYALKYMLHLPFVGPNNSDIEQKYPPQRDMTARHFQNAVSVFELERQMRDEHPLEPMPVPTGGRDYPDLEEGE